ncbi:CHAT domain-containing protein [Hymenobacter jeollabukensis]|uniref:CHAT domain-containing protein n=1 Tax=Hymenobacter jeollabukensis TaxID=2025313 RepID=A0A5R8WJ07_9BACT|nr:CHAT domain-containing protein [Hymenobacter jeollabukensis]TLM88877.1 CHAT domain-containing protein [Hymenobacter jeollabukensis]
MSKHLSTVAVLGLFGLVAYLLVNIVHLVWTYVNPEGFWSFQVFLDVLRTTFFGLLFVVLLLVAFGILCNSIYRYVRGSLRRDINKGNPLHDLAYVVVLLVSALVEYWWARWWVDKIDSALADKYSYVTQSKKLIAAGSYDQALTEARAAYEHAQAANVGSGKFFLLTHIYQKSSYARLQQLSNTYATTVNYAFCLAETNTSTSQADSLYSVALRLAESKQFSTQPEYRIFPLVSLSQLSLAQGQYQRAERYFDALLPYAQLAQGEDIDYAISALFIFAQRAYQTGQPEKALGLITHAVTLYEQSEESRETSFYARLLISAGLAELRAQRLTQAGQYLVKAQQVVDSKRSKQVYLDFLHAKGIYCMQAAQAGTGDEALLQSGFWHKLGQLLEPARPLTEQFRLEAEQCLQELAAESKDRNGAKSVAYAQNMLALAQLYTRQRQFSQAQPLNDQALGILREVRSSNQDAYFEAQLQGTVNRYYANKKQPLEPAIREVEQYYFTALASRFALFTEEEREHYVLGVSNVTNTLNSIRLLQGGGTAGEQVYNSILGTKSVALFATQHLRQALAGAKGQELSNYHRLLSDRAALNRRRLTGASEAIVEETELKSREKQLLYQLATTSHFTPFNPGAVRWNDVRQALQDRETAIEIVALPTRPLAPDSLTYYALLTQRAYAQPKVVPLFQEHRLTRLLNQAGATEARVNRIYQEKRDSLYQLIWAPIASEVAGSRKIYLSVSGVLHTVSFAGFLPPTTPEVVLLSSTRQLTTRRDAAVGYKAAALFGNINYDYTTKRADSAAALRSAVNTAKWPRSHFAPLPYTAVELASIQNLLERRVPGAVTLFEDTVASEAAFMRVAQANPTVLHVATHGFFLPSKSSTNQFNLSVGSSAYDEQPLSRSGIILAGANAAGATQADHDGILTAEELARLDMAHVDLVVLSACETALGTVKGSEGIYGLQRALKMAGVRSFLVSLWKVPDKQTAELMALFYEGYVQGLPKNIALKRAQLAMQTKYAQPFYWAGFQLLTD